MKISDRQFVLLKRLQVLTGVLPVGLFLLSHFAINGRAIAGRDAYRSGVTAIARLPWLAGLEVIAIALPLVAHLALGCVLGLTAQGAFEGAHPDVARRWLQRATGLYLAMFVVIHVWSLRLSPDRRAETDLFELVAMQLRHPASFALNALAVIAAALHFSIGCSSLFGPHAFALSPGGVRAARITGLAGFVVLAGLGLNALLAFVWPAAQWLAPR